MAASQDNKDGQSAPRATSRWLKRFTVKLVIVVVILVALVGFAEHRTSKPDFCGSCHIMDPYYETWAADLHGKKIGAACVDCHYAPGERTTIKAKLRGLSQVASYFSGRYGATRPRAHVSNDSCMTAKCHGDQQFMDKEITIGTVKFKHSNHLGVAEAKLEENAEALATLSKTIEDAVADPLRFERLKVLANESGDAADRLESMMQLVIQWKVPLDREQIEKFSEYTHRRVRVAQLSDLQCTTCHAYAPPEPTEEGDLPEHHFSVATTSCYTCHFNNADFNSGTGKCLMCHTLPTEEVTVHEEVNPEVREKLGTSDLGATPVKMNHQLILERQVSCRACHADVASEDAPVSRRDCQRCHDQPQYFADWQVPFTVEQVEKYHKSHVPGQHAKCLDCHTEIQHQLIRDESVGKAGFMASAISNCTQCHPNHHAEQVSLLRGTGGIGVPKGDPNMMFGSRTNCYGCHTEHALDDRGIEIMKATENGCIACHGDKHIETFEKWKLGLEFSMTDAEEAFQAAQKMLDEADNLSDENRKKASDLLDSARADLMLVKRGNGLHNIMYSMELLDSVATRCRQAMGVIAESQ